MSNQQKTTGINAGCSWPMKLTASIVIGVAIAQIPSQILISTGINIDIAIAVGLGTAVVSGVLTWILLGRIKQTASLKMSPEDIEDLKVKRDVRRLIEVLRNDVSWKIRCDAAVALGQIRDPQAIAPLSDALKDIDSPVRNSVAEALIEIGLPANLDETTKAWLAVAKEDWESAISLGESAVEPLRFCLKDTDWEIRGRAAQALEKVNPAVGITPTDKVWIAIGKREWDQIIPLGSVAVPPLSAILQDADNWSGEERSEFARVLGKIGNEQAIIPLCAALGTKDEDVRKAVIDSLVGFGGKAVGKLVEIIQVQNNTVENKAVEAVKSQINIQLVRPLTDTEKSRIWGIQAEYEEISIPRKAAAEALGRIGTLAIEPLVAILSNPQNNWGVKVATIEALAMINSEKAIEPLRFALKDNNPTVQQYAKEALEKLEEKMG